MSTSSLEAKTNAEKEILLVLSSENFEELTEKINKHFFDKHIQIIDENTGNIFYIGYCNEKNDIFKEYEKVGKVQLQKEKKSYLINLLPEAVNELKLDKEYSLNHNDSKLIIKIERPFTKEESKI